jgi:hypothetical protein
MLDINLSKLISTIGEEQCRNIHNYKADDISSAKTNNTV